MSCAKGMLTKLPRKFDTAAAATIEVSRCLRIATVMVEIEITMSMASADAAIIGNPAGAADDDRDARESHEARQQRSRRGGLAQPQPGDRSGGERLEGNDDRDIGDAGELQGRNEADHAEGGEAGNEPAIGLHRDQAARATPALGGHEEQSR